MRRTSPPWRIALLIACLALLALPLSSAFAHPLDQSAVVASPTTSLTIRSGPGTHYDAIGRVSARTPLPVLGRSTDSAWLLVNFGPGTENWVAGWLCEIEGDLNTVPVVGEAAPPAAPPPVAGSTVTATTTVNLRYRSAPDFDATLLGTIPVSTTLVVQGRNELSTWVLITYAGKTGWVYTVFTDLSGDLSTVPVPSAVDVASAPAPAAPAAAPVSAAPAVPYTATITGIGPNARAIYQRGQQLGNNPHRFSKIGDCEAESPYFLIAFDDQFFYLGDYIYLHEVIWDFAGSFSRIGYAAKGGYVVNALLDPTWADPSVCWRGETPLECELRSYKPAIALIMVRTYPKESTTWAEDYYAGVSRIVDIAASRGVIPVLSTVPYLHGGGHTEMNEAIRRVAAEKQVPLWDFWQTTSQLPNQGVELNISHLTVPADFGSAVFLEDRMHYGMVRRNLEALEVLHAVKHQAMQ
ncbi:MAG: SH3 domain-containing protein [Anaerolineae bacterium]|nr:SH3 domain-containing protein [Anaerolineae bacterium]